MSHCCFCYSHCCAQNPFERSIRSPGAPPGCTAVCMQFARQKHCSTQRTASGVSNSSAVHAASDAARQHTLTVQSIAGAGVSSQSNCTCTTRHACATTFTATPPLIAPHHATTFPVTSFICKFHTLQHSAASAHQQRCLGCSHIAYLFVHSCVVRLLSLY